MSHPQSLSFKTVTDEKQTKTAEILPPPRRYAKSQLHQIQDGDTVLAPLKRVRIRRRVSPIGGAENLEKIHPL